MINKCFCTRRNPISISAAAIYLACQLEDKRKTQAEICKVTGLTEVTLRKVYKELLENWDDLLPSNYNPVVPPEKAFPTATITSGRSLSRNDITEGTSSDREKFNKQSDSKVKEQNYPSPLGPSFWKSQGQNSSQNMEIDKTSEEKRADGGSSSILPIKFPTPPTLAAGVVPWPFRPPVPSSISPSAQFLQSGKGASSVVDKGSVQESTND